jgi:hypothetical protein
MFAVVSLKGGDCNKPFEPVSSVGEGKIGLRNGWSNHCSIRNP